VCAAAIGVVLAGCSLVQPAAAPVDRSAQALRLVRDGRHADAARLYVELADGGGADRDYYRLQAADQWTAAAGYAEAHAQLDAVTADGRAKFPVLRALVAAELAVAEHDGARAIRELDLIPVPTQADEAASYWWLRGKGAFLASHPVEGTRAFVERERYLPDPAALHASREDLYGWLRTAAQHGTSLKVPAKTDGTVAGWLEAGPVAAELARDPVHAAAPLASWRKRYPGHPANEVLFAASARPVTAPPVAMAWPDQVALLLPLSGPNEAVGVAVRDGFLAAYFAEAIASRPHLRIYDVGAQPAASAYTQAVEDGASFVVGPLTKEDVAEVAPLADRGKPLLALNFLGDGAAIGRNVYQFALSPEDEARSAARRVVGDGHLRGIAILPDGDLGSRVGAAFADELARLGGSLAETDHYESGRADFSEIIKRSLQVHGVRGEPSTHRSDVSFVFLAGTPGASRLIVAQLKFHYAGDIPAYATSDSFEPGPAANSDIDGLILADMPWMVSPDPVVQQQRDAVHAAWPARATRRDRLYAFGFDAFRLAPLLSGKAGGQPIEVDGMTGRLRIDARNRVRRELDWVQIRNGIPTGL
jgi:outer membrane PBP1 activator LpoA protein